MPSSIQQTSEIRRRNEFVSVSIALICELEQVADIAFAAREAAVNVEGAIVAIENAAPRPLSHEEWDLTHGIVNAAAEIDEADEEW